MYNTESTLCPLLVTLYGVGKSNMKIECRLNYPHITGSIASSVPDALGTSLTEMTLNAPWNSRSRDCKSIVILGLVSGVFADDCVQGVDFLLSPFSSSQLSSK